MKTKILSACLTLTIILSIFMSGCGFRKNQTEQSQQPQPQFDYSAYEEVDVDSLMKALEVNPAKVAQVVKNKKLKIVGGKIVQIDSDGDSFSIDTGLFSFDITCNVKSNSVAQKQLLEIRKGQQVDIYGQISHVGEVLGYSVDVDRIELPGQNSAVTSNNKSAQKTSAKKQPAKDDSAEVKNVINNFMSAFVKRNPQGMKQYSFCESRMYSENEVFALLDDHIQVWDTVLEIIRDTSGRNISYEWQIERLNKVDGNTYSADIRFIMSTDSLLFPDVTIKNIGGAWKVDSESFAISSGVSFTNTIMNSGYGY